MSFSGAFEIFLPGIVISLAHIKSHKHSLQIWMSYEDRFFKLTSVRDNFLHRNKKPIDSIQLKSLNNIKCTQTLSKNRPGDNSHLIRENDAITKIR